MSWIDGINTFCRLVRLGVETLETIVCVRKVYSTGRNATKTDVADAVVKTSLVFLGVKESYGRHRNFSSEALAKIKKSEKWLRAANVPIQIIKWERVEKSLVLPIVSFVRAYFEQEAYEAQHHLTLTDEELGKRVEMPVFFQGKEGFEIVGYRPYTKKEAEDELKDANSLSSAFSKLELSSKFELGTAVYYRIKILFVQSIKGQTGLPHIRPRPPANLFDLRALRRIPAELHNDAALSQFECAITQEPIRHVAGDPNGHTIYELNAITRWLGQNATSPITRAPLQSDQLVPKPAIQDLIDQRLDHYELGLHAQAVAMNADPVPAGPLAAALAEL